MRSPSPLIWSAAALFLLFLGLNHQFNAANGHPSTKRKRDGTTSIPTNGTTAAQPEPPANGMLWFLSLDPMDVEKYDEHFVQVTTIIGQLLIWGFIYLFFTFVFFVVTFFCCRKPRADEDELKRQPSSVKEEAFGGKLGGSAALEKATTPAGPKSLLEEVKTAKEKLVQMKTARGEVLDVPPLIPVAGQMPPLPTAAKLQSVQTGSKETKTAVGKPSSRQLQAVIKAKTAVGASKSSVTTTGTSGSGSSSSSSSSGSSTGSYSSTSDTISSSASSGSYTLSISGSSGSASITVPTTKSATTKTRTETTKTGGETKSKKA